jgi:hypothetical protein
MRKSPIVIFLTLMILTSGFSSFPLNINHSEETPQPPSPVIGDFDLSQSPEQIDQLKLENPESSLSPVLAGVTRKIDVAVTGAWETNPKVASCGYDEYLTVFTKDQNIYGQRVTKAGALLGTVFIINVNDGFSSRASEPDVACEWTRRRYIVVWTYDYSSTGTDLDIHGQALFGSHEAMGSQWVGGLLVVDNELGNQEHPAISCNRHEYTCLVTYDSAESGNGDIYGRRILDGASVITMPDSDFQIGAFSVEDTQSDVAWGVDDENFMVVWQNLRDASPDKYTIVYAMVYDTDQATNQIKKGGTYLIGFSPELNHQTEPSVAYNPRSNTFFAALTYEFSTTDTDIIGKYHTGDGVYAVGTKRYYFSTSSPEFSPSVAWNGGAEALSTGAGADEFSINYILYSGSTYYLKAQSVTGTYESPYSIGSQTTLYSVGDTVGKSLSIPDTCGSSATGRYFTAWQYAIGGFSPDYNIYSMLSSPYAIYQPLLKKP